MPDTEEEMNADAPAETTETPTEETTTTETTTTTTEATTTEAPEVIEEPVIPESTLEDALADLGNIDATLSGFFKQFGEDSHKSYLGSDAALNATYNENLKFNDQRVADAKATCEKNLKILDTKREDITSKWESARVQTKELHDQAHKDQEDFYKSETKELIEDFTANLDKLLYSWSNSKVAGDTPAETEVAGDTPAETVDTAGDTPAEETV